MQSKCRQIQTKTDNHNSEDWNFHYSTCNPAHPGSYKYSKDDEYFSMNLQADSLRNTWTITPMIVGISSSQQEQSERRSVLCCRLRRRSAVSPYWIPEPIRSGSNSPSTTHMQTCTMFSSLFGLATNPFNINVQTSTKGQRSSVWLLLPLQISGKYMVQQ